MVKQLPKHPLFRIALVVLILECAGAFSLVAGLLSFRQSASNQQGIDQTRQLVIKLNAALDREAAQAAASATLATHFFDEINYICTISADRAEIGGLPPPAPGVCAVSANQR